MNAPAFFQLVTISTALTVVSLSTAAAQHGQRHQQRVQQQRRVQQRTTSAQPSRAVQQARQAELMRRQAQLQQRHPFTGSRIVTPPTSRQPRHPQTSVQYPSHQVTTSRQYTTRPPAAQPRHGRPPHHRSTHPSHHRHHHGRQHHHPRSMGTTRHHHQLPKEAFLNPRIWMREGDQVQVRPGIHPNFRQSWNYATRPGDWGRHAWWANHPSHQWHRGSWNYGWGNPALSSSSHTTIVSTPFVGQAVPQVVIRSAPAWGLASWGLGNLVYDMGYCTYHNPYSPPLVPYGNESVSYDQPLSYWDDLTEEEARQLESETVADSPAAQIMNDACAAFKSAQYDAALSLVDTSIGLSPGDPALHEFRALVLFALGRYEASAGVLHSLLASSPGWDWATMIGLYRSPDDYTKHFRHLEHTVTSSPNEAGPCFLLGYHYMVGASLHEAKTMFDRVAMLQPENRVAIYLRGLASSSIPSSAVPDLASAAEPATEYHADSLVGKWKATSDEGKQIELTLDNEGQFSWNYEGKGTVLSGQWSTDDTGRLILSEDEVQVVADVLLEGSDQMQFVLSGTVDGDIGVNFERF